MVSTVGSKNSTANTRHKRKIAPRPSMRFFFLPAPPV